MNQVKQQHICPVERAGMLESGMRRVLQNPQKITGPYIRAGMTVLDLGCGPGYFTREMAHQTGISGRVIAVDVQSEMLQKLKDRVAQTDLEHVIYPHLCRPHTLALQERVEFVLAFYVIHELPDPVTILQELKSLLRPGGKVLIAEPLFHVSKKAFLDLEETVQNIGFRVLAKPNIFFSRSMLLGH